MNMEIHTVILASFFIMVGCATAIDQHAQEFLDGHNALRNETGGGLPSLEWDDKVAAYARDYANQRAGDCQLIHSNGPYGENIYWGFGEGYIEPNAAIKYWADEVQYYDYDSNTCQPGKECLHYTQMVWRNSKHLGCASVTCGNGNTFITCNYDPPGNWEGEKPY